MTPVAPVTHDLLRRDLLRQEWVARARGRLRTYLGGGGFIPSSRAIAATSPELLLSDKDAVIWCQYG